jgi:hypothetical protein
MLMVNLLRGVVSSGGDRAAAGVGVVTGTRE